MRRAAVVALIALAAVVVWAVARERDLRRRAPRGSVPARPPAARTSPPPASAEETEAPARGVAGVVTDGGGTPLAGAAVRAHSVWQDGSIRRWDRGVTQTDGSGAYAFDDLWPGRYAIQATHEDARSPRRIVALESAARVDLRVAPTPVGVGSIRVGS